MTTSPDIERVLAGLAPRTSAHRDRLESWLSSHERRFTAEAKGDTLELAVMDVIGESFFFEGVTAKKVKAALDANPDAKVIRVLIDSPGGFTHDGLAIQALLKRSGARVETEVLGEASSAASVVMLAGDRVLIHEGATVMIHRASSCACGFAEDLRTHADALDTITSGIVDIYTTRTGKPRDEIASLVQAETWMSAAQAVELGFADEVIPAISKGAKPKKPKAQATKIGDLAVSLGPFEGTPKEVAGRITAAMNISPGTPGPAPEEAPAPTSDPKEETIMTFPKNITQALALAEDADDAAVASAITKLKTSASVGSKIETLLGVAGDAAVGAVRALKETNEKNATLADEVEKLKVVNARRDFVALIGQGTKDKKLSPAQAKFYNDKFDKAVEKDEDGVPKGDGMDVVEDLRGFLAVSPRQGGSVQQVVTEGTNVGAAQHNGKPFEDMTPSQRLKLKGENVELYNTLRDDALSRGVL